VGLSSLLQNVVQLPGPIQDKIANDRQRAVKMLEAGEENALIEAAPIGVTTPLRYADFFAAEDLYDVLRNLPNVNVPVLVTLGSNEVVPASEVSLQGPSLLMFVSLNGLAAEMRTLAAKTPGIDFELIEGANHFYAGKYDEVWSAVRRWLSQRMS
jgi:pimeloyl-ACP methyl ester carboxylesterase